MCSNLLEDSSIARSGAVVAQPLIGWLGILVILPRAPL